MTEGIVEILRTYADRFDDDDIAHEMGMWVREAADAIEHLRNDLAEVRHEYEKLSAKVHRFQQTIADLVGEQVLFEVDRDRWRSAAGIMYEQVFQLKRLDELQVEKIDKAIFAYNEAYNNG
jgi:chromosome segregation ATPase